MRQKYILYCQHTSQHSKKLEFYNNCKNDYKSSYYLDLTKKSNERKELVKFRIRNHKLSIEIGRFDQIPTEGRLCLTYGSNRIEDEVHFFFVCPKYSTLWDEFYRKIKYHLPNIKQLSPIEATIELMNSPNYFLNIQMLKFILSCLDFLYNLLSIQTNVT